MRVVGNDDRVPQNDRRFAPGGGFVKLLPFEDRSSKTVDLMCG